MIGVITRGLLYFAAVFAFAFVMGIVRTLVVAPRIGATAAVCIEIPIILTASWFVARRLLRGGSFSLGQRMIIGAIAFILTMASEAALAAMLPNMSVSLWTSSLFTPLGLLGLAGQIGFAIIPIFAGRGPSSAARSGN